MKLFYFDFKARAETARLMLKLAGMTFEDIRFSGEEWGSKYKALSPSGQCPWIEMDDGRVMAQSHAIHLYCASQAGLLPKDPFQLARTVELQNALEEVFDPILDTFNIPDADEKLAARKAVIAPDGVMTKKMAVVERTVDAAPGEFFCGDEPTMADYHLFVFLGDLRSGVVDGITKEFIDRYEKVKAKRRKVANMGEVKKLYAGQAGFDA